MAMETHFKRLANQRRQSKRGVHQPGIRSIRQENQQPQRT